MYKDGIPSAALLMLIAFIEGFVSISLEILLIRQLLPFAGSSVVTTSIIIGIFLLCLAYGYRRGGLITQNHVDHLAKNFLWSALILGIGLSYIFIYAVFSSFYQYIAVKPALALCIYLSIIAAPLVYLLGQTIPIALHLFQSDEAKSLGKIGSRVLHINTLGSFLGAVLTSVVLFSWVGVAWTVMIATALLCGLILIFIFLFPLQRKFLKLMAIPVVLVTAYCLNLQFERSYFLRTNDYANYRVSTTLTAQNMIKQFEINNTGSSMLDAHGKGFPYIEKIKFILFTQLGFKQKKILILGAGGFTLSANNEDNDFMYVDIDPDIRNMSETYFSGPIHGDFIAQDARLFVTTTSDRFDAVVLDAYNTPLAMPSHLLTRDFFAEVAHVLYENGVVILNVIGTADFRDPYTRQLDNTLRQAFGFCSMEPLKRHMAVTNIIYVCYPNRPIGGIYTDDRNTATLDAFNMQQHWR